MTKDKLQDQKFIIYKAIRYLMSDISMQYHKEIISVYCDQHFKLCTDRFFYLFPSARKLGSDVIFDTTPQRVCGRVTNSFNLMNMVCFTSCRLAFDNLITRLELHILHTHDTIKVQDTGHLVNWVKI